MEQRPPMKPVLPPMPPMKPIPKPPFQPQPYPPYHPPKQDYKKQQMAVPCDPKMLHHMYRHMKMCHRYETQMLRMYMKWCKEQWKHRQHHKHHHNPCGDGYESSSYRRESSSHHHHDTGCGC